MTESLAAAFTTEQVMRITGISRRRLNYWLERGIVTPASHTGGRGHARLWTFDDLLEVRMALRLRDEGRLISTVVLSVETIAAELTDAIEQDRQSRRRPGEVERSRGRLGSTPVFSGTRVPVAAVQRLQAAGWGTVRILAEYPALTAADLAIAAEAARRAG